MGPSTVDLDRALALAGAGEDEGLLRRICMGSRSRSMPNVLLQAVNEDATPHERARRWLDQALSGADTVAFAWTALLAVVRLSTRTGPHLPSSTGAQSSRSTSDFGRFRGVRWSERPA